MFLNNLQKNNSTAYLLIKKQHFIGTNRISTTLEKQCQTSILEPIIHIKHLIFTNGTVTNS